MTWQVGTLVWILRLDLKNVCSQIVKKEFIFVLFIFLQKMYIQEFICRKKNVANVIDLLTYGIDLLINQGRVISTKTVQ